MRQARSARRLARQPCGRPRKVRRPTCTPGAQVTAHFQPTSTAGGGRAGQRADRRHSSARSARSSSSSAGVGHGLGVQPVGRAAVAEVGEMAEVAERDAAALPPTIGRLGRRGSPDSASTAVRGERASELGSRYDAGGAAAMPRHHAPADIRSSPSSAIDVPLGRLRRGCSATAASSTRSSGASSQALVDTTRARWAWRPDDRARRSAAQCRSISSRRRSASATCSSAAARGRRSCDSALDVRRDRIAATTRFVLEIDGQRLEYRARPPRTMADDVARPTPGTAVRDVRELGARQPDPSRARGPGSVCSTLRATSSARRTSASC